MHQSQPTPDKVSDFDNLNQNRKPSVSFSLTPSESEEAEVNGNTNNNYNCNYDAEAVTSHPKRNFMFKIKSNLNRAINFLSKGDDPQHQYNTYGEYPFGDQYRFRDWEAW